MPQQTLEKIERILRQKLSPTALEVRDDSAKHRGHQGAREGKGHYAVKIASPFFEKKSLVEQHQMVYKALDDLMKEEIHALQLSTFSE